MSKDFPQSRSERHSKYHQKSVLGGFSSFDGDSLPDYSEFDSESVALEYFKERYAPKAIVWPPRFVWFVMKNLHFSGVLTFGCDFVCALSFNNFLKIVTSSNFCRACPGWCHQSVVQKIDYY